MVFWYRVWTFFQTDFMDFVWTYQVAQWLLSWTVIAVIYTFLCWCMMKRCVHFFRNRANVKNVDNLNAYCTDSIHEYHLKYTNKAIFDCESYFTFTLYSPRPSYCAFLTIWHVFYVNFERRRPRSWAISQAPINWAISWSSLIFIPSKNNFLWC